MKWIILVYLSVYTNIGLPPNDMKHRRIEIPAADFNECMDISQQINDITEGHRGNAAITRSFYWVYNNMLEDIKAECVFANPLAPLPKWAENTPWLWNKVPTE